MGIIEGEISIDVFYEVACKFNYYIYGTGRIGDVFFRLMEEKGISNTCKGFVVTNAKCDDCFFKGRKVYSIEKIDSDALIFIATNVTSYGEIRLILKKCKIKNYFWILPLLFDLKFGKPLFSNVKIDVNYIIRHVAPRSWITICYLALDDYYKGNGYGKNFYIKYIGNLFPINVAKKDLKRYFDWADSLKKGHTQNFNIKINHEKSFLLDGAHRIALAKYFRRDMVLADLYNCDDEMYREFHSLHKSVEELEIIYLKNSFSESEIKLVFEVMMEISQ